MSTSTPRRSSRVHLPTRSFAFWGDADRAMRRLATAVSRPVTAWEARECMACPHRPIHVYERGRTVPVDWNVFSRAHVTPANPNMRGGRRA